MNMIEEASAGELLDMLRAIREAVSIPHPATAGDGEVYDKILLARVLQVRVMLNLLLEDFAGSADVAWSTGHLREKLAEHPPTGYRLYSELAADPKAFYAKVLGGGHVDG